MQNPTLSILIPSLKSRNLYLTRLLSALHSQIEKLESTGQVVIITEIDEGELSIGAKRNLLLDKARELNSVAVAFFDDDDMPGKNYLAKQVEAVRSGADCGSLIGNIYSGKVKDSRLFYHSNVFDHWYDDPKGYYRCPNHLNAIRLEHYDGLTFKDQSFGEDGQMSEAMQKTGRLKNEYKIREVIYHYFTGQNKDFAWELREMERVNQ